MNRIRKIAVAAAIAATLIGGSASAADATSIPRPMPSHAKYDGVKVCIAALKWAHAKSTADREDHAVIVCGWTVTTEGQAKRLYRWANKPANRWALELIG